MSPDIKALEETARKIREDIIVMLYEAKWGFTASSLSVVDLLTALYFYKMKIDPQKPDIEERDRFILSKGHSAPALYATLAHRGYFSADELGSYASLNSRLQAYPDFKTPGVDLPVASLGQGLSVAQGMAIAAKADKKKYHIYCLIGDGELEAGQVWEALAGIAFRKLDNLCLLVDINSMQQDGFTKKIKNMEPIKEKFQSFNWNVIAIDGHNLEEVCNALDKAEKTTGKPTAILAKTIKGKGVSFMEQNPEWHTKTPDREILKKALVEL